MTQTLASLGHNVCMLYVIYKVYSFVNKKWILHPIVGI